MALCVALSLVVHVGVVWLLFVLFKALPVKSIEVYREGRARPAQRALQIVTASPEDTKPKPFAKTNPDAEEDIPKQVDFVGKRDSAESAAEDAPSRLSDAPVPTQDGVEDDDIVTFDQEQQKGDLAFDGKEQQSLPPLPLVGAQLPPAPPPSPEVHSPKSEVEEAPAEGAAAVLPPPADDKGDVLIRQAEDDPRQLTSPPVSVQLDAAPIPSVRSGAVQPVYDPSLADHMQQKPGFRTHERRTRSTGRFVVGHKPALNVTATPQGRYEEEVYRRIAYFWYIACDEHRGDIIPGSVVISLRINSRGLLENMDLVRRTGASVSQQSFTFGAIRRATLPPMPPAVRQELTGDLLELIFQFNFD